jgi:hypothetical protein
MQFHLSSEGFAAVQGSISDGKNHMQVPSTQQNGTMSCCYSKISSQTLTVLSTTPLHATVTFNETLEGNASSNPPSAAHQGTVTARVGTKTQTITGQQVSPITYMQLTAKLVMDTNTDTCFTDAVGCFDYSGESVTCSSVGTVFSIQEGGSWKWEIAYTMTILTGTRYGCSGSNPQRCFYPVDNWCTAGSTPPDANFHNGRVSDIALSGFWKTWSLCQKIGTGMWNCSFSYAVGAGNTQDPASCTRNY